MVARVAANRKFEASKAFGCGEAASALRGERRTRADAGLDRVFTFRRDVLGNPVATFPDPTVPASRQSDPANLRTFVRLDGRESADSHGRPLTYLWSLVSAPAGSAVAGATLPVRVFLDGAPVSLMTTLGGGDLSTTLTLPAGLIGGGTLSLEQVDGPITLERPPCTSFES
jgi:hypothetical protein